ncbi:MAG: PhzF family phenazine biosynthesis protein [Sciscionella sp.]|nr:PhzF family phenazine biosynthesis protein [Sciscionella sp.]
MDVYVVDVFAKRPFAGNPAGVVLLTEPRSTEWMQHVAAELKHSETAFVSLTGSKRAGDPLPLRWFTPTTEVGVCGHATMAAVHVLGGTIAFGTSGGALFASAGTDGWVEVELPADRPVEVEPPAEIVAALGNPPILGSAKGDNGVLVEVDSPATVRGLRPDIDAIRRGGDGLIVTAADHDGRIGTAADRDSPSVDFVSRCFYPAQGIDEDPVTGAAHCLLACWWSRRLHRRQLVGEQASARGGLVHAVCRDDTVVLGGTAITVLSGRLTM